MRRFGEDADLLAEVGVDVSALTELEAAHERALDLPRGPRTDAHVHVGRDRDGHALSPTDLVADLDRFEIARAVIFPPNDPGVDGQFAQANRLVLDAADGHPARLVPFLRLDPMLPWERALSDAVDRGARGLKLHPVAQRIRPESNECAAVVAAATDAGLPVLVHAGFGARPLARPLASLVERVPGCRLILAHGGRGDAPALATVFAGHEGILFDTSLASLPDIVRLGPSRLVFGSDRPYGDILGALQLVSLAARVGEWTRDDTRSVLGGRLDAWLSLDSG
ncbi:MAG: amidohydrolase family protein [Actinobacteria bacterium]|nr:amidohydrolase family protein [Actinomycetota bacterium]